MSWLETHLEEFVTPVIGEFDRRPLGYFDPAELTVIKNVWRSVKKNAKGKQILLPGRDVFIFEVLARRENYPTIFWPECSRQTVEEMAEEIDHHFTRNVYLFDTGFVGSIPRALNTKKFGLLSYNDRSKTVGTQIFPHLSLSRGLALRIESTPKYWESGRVVPHGFPPSGEIHQDFSPRPTFVQAARLTIEIYTNSSPRFIQRHRPIERRWW